MFTGGGWILVGPSFSEGLASGVKAESITAQDNLAYTILRIEVSGATVGIISGSDASFVPKTTIAGFPQINPGFNVISRDTDSDGLSNYKFFGTAEKAGFDRVEAIGPKTPIKDVYGILPAERSKPYKSKTLLNCLVDDSTLLEYKAGFGKTIITAYARIDGWSVGVVMNNRELVKNAKGEMQFGGVIYSDAADKAARFIMNCNQKNIPLVFIHDVTGFMVGSKSEHQGIIKDGAKMVNAMANSIVPKFSIVIGNSYGAGNYAMCGKAYDPRLIVGWPTAEIAVMSGAAAAKTLLQIEVSSLKSKGEEITPEREKELFDKIKNKYDAQISPYYAASRLWIDAIIDPKETRNVISIGIDVANHKKSTEKYNVGVLQT